MSYAKTLYESPAIEIHMFGTLKSPLCQSPGDPYSASYNATPSMGWGDLDEQDF